MARNVSGGNLLWTYANLCQVEFTHVEFTHVGTPNKLTQIDFSLLPNAFHTPGPVIKYAILYDGCYTRGCSTQTTCL